MSIIRKTDHIHTIAPVDAKLESLSELYHSLTSMFRDRASIFLFVILLCSILLRLSNLSASVWYDELWSTHVKLENVIVLGNQIGLDFHPPSYSIFMFFWIRLFGDSELSIRTPPLILGVLSILVVYILSVKLADKKTALLTSLLLCLSPVHIWYSQEARQYSAALFFSLVSILGFYKLMEPRAKPVWYFIYVASLLLAVFAHYYVLLYLIAISLLCLRRINRTKKIVLVLNSFVAAALAGFFAIKFVFATIPLGTGSGYLRAFNFLELWRLFLNWFLFGNSLWTINQYSSDWGVLQNPLMFLTQIFFLCIFLRGLVLFYDRSDKSKESYGLDLILYLFLLPLFLMGLTWIGLRNTYIERSAFVLLPFFYLVLARGLTDFKTRKVTIVLVAFAVLFNIVTVAAFFEKSDMWTVFKPKVDWRSAAHFFDAKTINNPEPLFVFAQGPVPELTYYDSRFIDPAELQEKAHTKLDRLTRFFGQDNYFAKLLSAEIDKNEQFKREAMLNWKLEIYYLDNTEELYDRLSAQNSHRFYFVVTYVGDWSAELSSLLSSLKRDTRFQFLDDRHFKGITISEFGVVQGKD